MADAKALAEFAMISPNGDGERPAGEAIEVGRMKSSRFMGSLVDTAGCWVSSFDFRNCAMPLGTEVEEGALVGCFFRRLVFLAGSAQHRTNDKRTHLLRSSSIRRRFMAIILQVKFSMRSALGNWVLALL
jgi:hypothetical protein